MLSWLVCHLFAEVILILINFSKVKNHLWWTSSSRNTGKPNKHWSKSQERRRMNMSLLPMPTWMLNWRWGMRNGQNSDFSLNLNESSGHVMDLVSHASPQVFHSVQRTCMELLKMIEQYQRRISCKYTSNSHIHILISLIPSGKSTLNCIECALLVVYF